LSGTPPTPPALAALKGVALSVRLVMGSSSGLCSVVAAVVHAREDSRHAHVGRQLVQLVEHRQRSGIAHQGRAVGVGHLRVDDGEVRVEGLEHRDARADVSCR
jgi:hypothetical protein